MLNSLVSRKLGFLANSCISQYAADSRAIWSQNGAISHTIGLAENQHLQAPREVNVMFSSRTTQEWDPTFVANVKRDGIVLFQRGELPAPFAA